LEWHELESRQVRYVVFPNFDRSGVCAFNRACRHEVSEITIELFNFFVRWCASQAEHERVREPSNGVVVAPKSRDRLRGDFWVIGYGDTIHVTTCDHAGAFELVDDEAVEPSPVRTVFAVEQHDRNGN